MRASDIADSVIAMDRNRARADIYLDSDFDKAGAMVRIWALAGADVSSAKMFRFLDSGVKLNIIRQTQGSLNPVAPGMSCYISFCDLLSVDYPPNPRANRLKQ